MTNRIAAGLYLREASAALIRDPSEDPTQIEPGCVASPPSATSLQLSALARGKNNCMSQDHRLVSLTQAQKSVKVNMAHSSDLNTS
jgi:hypothetical protein